MPKKTDGLGEQSLVFSKFDGGLNTKYPAWQLPANQSPDVRNIDIDALPGVLKKRSGFTKYNSSAEITEEATTLSAGINDSVTTVPVASSTKLASAGTVRIDTELIIYTSTDATNLLGCTRGAEGTTEAAHSNGASVLDIGIHSLYFFRKTAAAATYFIASAGKNIYHFTTTAKTKISSDDLTAHKVVRYATINDSLYFVNGAQTLRKWTGAAYSTIAADPSGGTAYFIKVYDNRLFLFSSDTYPSRFWYTAIDKNGLPTPEDFTTASNAGFRAVNENDGDFINGVVVMADRMYIFKQFSIYMLTGHDPLNYLIRPLNDSDNQGIGCINPDTIKVIGTTTFFLSVTGFWAITSENKIVKLSDHITPTIQGISSLASCKSGVYRNQYWSAYYKSGSTSNNRALCLNYRNQAWVDYPGILANCFVYDPTTDIFYAGSPINGYIYQLDNGTTDDGTAITRHYETPAFDYDKPECLKQAHSAYLVATKGTGYSTTMAYKVNGGTASTPVTISLAGTGIATIKQPMVQATRGNYLALILEDTTATDIYGLSVYSNVLPPA